MDPNHFHSVAIWSLSGLTLAQNKHITDEVAEPQSRETTSQPGESTTKKGNPEEVIRWRQQEEPLPPGSRFRRDVSALLT